MRVSKSLMPFGQKADDVIHEPIGRPRGRSSLDTFVIPGRTRFPSSKLSAPEPVDLQITQGLLNPDAFKVPKMTANRADIPRTWFTSEHGPSSDESPKSHRQVSGRSIVIVKTSPKRRTIKRSKTLPNLDTGEAVGKPARNDCSEESQTSLSLHRLASRSSEQELNPFDGPFDSGPESLPTSGTWTTVSNRIFTDSSAGSSSRETQGFVDQYNKLALKHGLPRFTEPPVPIDIAKDTLTDVKVTSKSHNNWLMRKILRRSSSSYNVKVKSANKRVVRKLSVSSISERSRKEVLKDKSLEEIGRLSGLSILVLPPEFAVDKLTLPTCLSATATYLSQHGRTTPGVFRVPGQQITVNALYDYYAHQYCSADSIPDQVQQTVGSGLLPTHIPHSVHDVASVFKKLIAGLSGGLLGSILLFKALRSITDHLHPNPELPDSQNTKTRASLIALAISSVTSSLRVSLIWAVLGLAALIGHEAEKAEQADKIAGKDGERQRRVSFELMGYRSLGVVLGPLLLGDLTDQVAVSDENERGGLLVLPGNTKQRRKEKKKEKGQDNKLEQSSDLIAHVDRANVTARVMEMLIGNWQEVVKQLRIINATRNGGLLATSESRQGLVSANSKLTMRPSEEELLFEFLRGRPSNGDFERSMKIKKRVKISSTSPSSHRAIWATDSSQGSRYSKKSSGIASRKNVGKHTVDEIREVADVSDTDEAPQDVSKGESAKLLTYSALASPGPAGLVLQHPFTSRDLERDNILESCENAAELVDTQASLLPSTYQFIGYPLPEADLPNITAPQVAVTTSHPENGVAKTDYQEEEQAPEQQYIDQVPLPSMTAEHRQTHPAQAARVETELTKQSHADNSISPTSAATNSHAEEPRLLVPIRHNSVRQLAQLFGTAPTCPERKGRSLDIPPLKHQAYARHLSADSTTPAPPSPTAPRSPLQLPTQSPSADKSTPRSAHDSLIPKPVLDLGRGRQPVSRSPSPTRSPLPPNRTSVISIPADRKPGPDSPRTTSRSLSRTKTPLPTTLHAITPPRRIHSTGPPTRRPNPDTFPAPKLVPLTAHARVALSAESLLRVRAALEGPPIAYRLRTTRSMSSERSSVQGPVQRAGFGTDAETDPATTTSALTYPPATNATLHASIRRLHLALAAKSEEATQARRSLDAVREAREGMGADGVKGTLSEEVREARREAGMWRRRAEWAEARLLALGLEGAVGEEVGGEDGGVRVKGEEGGEMQTEGGVSVNRCNERGEKGKGQEGGKMETEGGVSVNRCNERGEMTAGDVLEVQVRWDGA